MERIDEESYAIAYDEIVAPVWGERTGSLLLDTVKAIGLPTAGNILISQCRTGLLPARLVSHLKDGTRIIAVDSSGEMLDRARRRLGSTDQKRVFFATQPIPKLNYADNVFPLTMCDSGIVTKSDLSTCIKELHRVTNEEGKVAIALPVRGSFWEFYDFFREALLVRSLDHLEEELERHLDTLCTLNHVESMADEMGLSALETGIDEFTIRFDKGEEFLFSPYVQHSYLSLWLDICKEDTLREGLFFSVLKQFNTYFEGLGIDTTVHIAAFVGQKR